MLDVRLTERRIALRVEARLPADFVVRCSGGGEFRWLVGATTNASKSGILLDVPGPVNVVSGSEGRVRISVYRGTSLNRPLRFLTAQAVVRRIYPARDRIGMTRLALEFRENLAMHTPAEDKTHIETLMHELGFV